MQIVLHVRHLSWKIAGGGPLSHSLALSPRVVINCVKHQSLCCKSPLCWRLSLEHELRRYFKCYCLRSEKRDVKRDTSRYVWKCKHIWLVPARQFVCQLRGK